MISFSGFPDQGATYFYEMARSLASLGHHVTAVAVQRDGQSADAFEDGVRVVRIPMPLTIHWASPIRWVRKLHFLGRAAWVVRRGRFDIVHVYCTLGAFLVPLLGGQGPRWVQEHQTGAVSFRWRTLRRVEDRLRALQGRAFDANFTVSAVLGRRLFGDTSRFREVPAGVNLVRFRPGLSRDFRQTLAIGSDDVVFVHAGVLEGARETDVPIRAMAIALQSRPNLRLLMPGKGSQLAELRALVRELDIQQRVWLPGYIAYEMMPRVFAAADAGLSYLPPVDYYEGQPPMKVMEYLGAGLPVIASDVSSHRTLVEDGRNGLLTAPGAERLAEALVRFASDAALQRRLAAAARSSVERLTYDNVARERVLPAYVQMLTERRG
jgi:glycosyltransferase involved in cell wall biosynthesis